MIGNILAAVAGSAASAILGGGGRSSQRLPQFDRRPARFRRKGRERYGTRHPRLGKITRRIRFGWYNSNTYQSSRGDA
jgi:hypothetical protein